MAVRLSERRLRRPHSSANLRCCLSTDPICAGARPEPTLRSISGLDEFQLIIRSSSAGPRERRTIPLTHLIALLNLSHVAVVHATAIARPPESRAIDILSIDYLWYACGLVGLIRDWPLMTRSRCNRGSTILRQVTCTAPRHTWWAALQRRRSCRAHQYAKWGTAFLDFDNEGLCVEYSGDDRSFIYSSFPACKLS